MRDDFTEKTKRLIGIKVAYCCSKPDCQKPTVGANSDGNAIMNVGVVSHITAAARGGPRYDSSLTREQRRHEFNGIWLCQTHGKLIDSDSAHFTVETIRGWKALAETKSFRALAYSIGEISAPIVNVSSDIDAEFVNQLNLTANDNLESVTVSLLRAAQIDLATFKNISYWPQHPIFLGLKLVEGDDSKPFEVANLALINERFNEITVIAPPGTGKTTTLLQFTDTILSRGNVIAVFFPLNEWASSTESLLPSLVNRRAFKGLKPDHFMLVAHYGRLALILDGWNELSADAKNKVSSAIKSLRRDYPGIRIILSTRQYELDIPVSGPVVKIDNLTEEQQSEIALSLRGKEGEAILDHAWRTRGIRELIAIPLYLTALLSQITGDKLPTTKEEVLRMFVSNHESDCERAAVLKNTLFGIHKLILISIATEATHAEMTAIPEIQARAIVKTTIDQLISEGQISSQIEPAKILDTFINLHMMVRSDVQDGTISFQHQQFQEWYSSFTVERLMLSAATGNTDSLKDLRVKILDKPLWEEQILFACERLSRTDQSGIDAVSFTILETFSIDPILSAEMIYRSSDETWQKINKQVLDFVGKWHTPAHIDRAVTFMISSGRGEFENQIWTLLENENTQVHLPTMRASSRFRPSVLGNNIHRRIASLSEKLREHLISEIAIRSGMDGIELATELAKKDESAEVRVEVISSLLFRRAGRFAADILKNSSDQVWAMVAKRGYIDEISDSECSDRLRAEKDKYIDTESDPLQKIYILLNSDYQSKESAKEIKALIEAVELSPDRQTDKWTIDKAFEIYPDEVISALLKRLEIGKEMPFRAENFLQTSGVIIDDGPIVDWLLSPQRIEEHNPNMRVALSIIGPDTINRLFQDLLEVEAEFKRAGRPHSKELSDKYYAIKGWIAQTNPQLFIQAILNWPTKNNVHEMAIFADLIVRHGKSSEQEKFDLNPEVYAMVADRIGTWAKALVKSQESKRYELAEITRAIERFPSENLLPALQELLDADLSRRQKAQEEFESGLKEGKQINNGARIFFGIQYAKAFSAIGSNQAADILKTYLSHADFGEDAAVALRAIWKKQQPPSAEDSRFTRFPDFSVVREIRERSTSENRSTENHPFVDDILSVVVEFLNLEATEANQKHALKLAKIAFSMSYTGKHEIIKKLLQLSLPAAAKQELLTILVVAGEIVSADLILQGINDLFETENDPKKSWMLHDNDYYRLRNWLVLLPYSDRPNAIVDILEIIKERIPDLLQPWKLRDLLSALGYAPATEVENILVKLIQINSAFLSEHDWLAALMKCETFSAAQILLDLISNNTFASNKVCVDVLKLGKKLAQAISAHSELRDEVYKRYLRLDGSAKAVLEYAISETPDVDGIILLIRECGTQGRSLQHTNLYSAIRHISIGERQSKNLIGAYEQYPVSAQELRKEIFKIINFGERQQSNLASECLMLIDEFRDDYGRAESELRHPDIESGIPWPQILESSVAIESNLLNT